jgi:hypothetical protein
MWQNSYLPSGHNSLIKQLFRSILTPAKKFGTTFVLLSSETKMDTATKMTGVSSVADKLNGAVENVI